MRYANAGHDLPYLHPSNGNAEQLKARGMPLGLMPGMGYEEKEIVLEADEVTLLYSDGLVEDHNPQREMLVSLGCRRSLLSLVRRDLWGLTARGARHLRGEGWEQEDDITLLTLRRSAASR